MNRTKHQLTKWNTGANNNQTISNQEDYKSSKCKGQRKLTLSKTQTQKKTRHNRNGFISVISTKGWATENRKETMKMNNEETCFLLLNGARMDYRGWVWCFYGLGDYSYFVTGKNN